MLRLTTALAVAAAASVVHAAEFSPVEDVFGPIYRHLASTNATCSVQARVNLEDNDIGSVPGANVTDCCDKCSNFTGCWAWSWTNYNNGTCWLKSMKGQVKVAGGVDSGWLEGAPTAAPVTLRPLTPRPTTSSPLPSDHVQWKIRSGVIPARSANLGGWLVAEYWMTYKAPIWVGLDYKTANSGEYITMKKLGKEEGTARFEAHRSTWITEADIAEIAASGLNTVRVSIGFWIINDDPAIEGNEITDVYAKGGLKYLDKLINEWAVKYNIAVMLSLHAHQGSQSGMDHSAPLVLDRSFWAGSQANINNSIQFATYIAGRYHHSEAFLGLNIMNEPASSEFAGKCASDFSAQDQVLGRRLHGASQTRARKVTEATITWSLYGQREETAARGCGASDIKRGGD